VDGRYCLPECTPESVSTCRENYLCHSLLKVCYPDCRAGMGCAEGFLCGDNGECTFDWPVLNAIGDPCQTTSDCVTNWCLPATDDDGETGWTGGTCTVPCGPAPPGCPPGTGCMIMEGEAYCLLHCVGPPTGDQCREGYVCDPDVHLCLPDCNDGFPCGEQLECKPNGVCMPPGRRGPPPHR